MHGLLRVSDEWRRLSRVASWLLRHLERRVRPNRIRTARVRRADGEVLHDLVTPSELQPALALAAAQAGS